MAHTGRVKVLIACIVAVMTGLPVTASVAAEPDPQPSVTPTVSPDPSPSPTKKPKPKPKPKKKIERVRVSISPSSGKFGVGQLITARFSSPVRYKAKAEAGMRVTSRDPLPKGAWGWINSTTAVYRPKTFWPGRTRIAVRLNLRKVPLNSDAKTRWVGGKTTDRKQSWRTARSFIARINGKTHQMRVYRNGVLVKVFGVSLGKPGFRTRSGVKVITGEKYRVIRMTSESLGLTDEFYDLQVPYAVRITPTGEFVHAAPWAASRIGVFNGSHGCTNLHTIDARWFYNNVQPGDVTVTKGTGRPMETWNGTPGSYWNYPWKDWKAKSALR